MRIILVNPLMQPSERENEMLSKWPPLGLAYIAALAEREGYKADIFERRVIARRMGDRNKLIQNVDAITIKHLDEFRPDIVGITATTPLIMDAFHTAKLIKNYNEKIMVVLGGAHPTAEPIYSLEQAPEVDVLVRGEGELAMLELMAGKQFDKIKGILYRSNTKIIFNGKAKVVEDLDTLPFPARHLFDRDFYFSPNSVLVRGYYGVGTNILTARGCPFNCAFCQSSQIREANSGRHIRFQSPEYVMDEIKHLVETYGIQLLVFAEDIFSLNRQRVFRICDLIVEHGFNKSVKFAVNLRVDTMDEEILQKMKMSGIVRAIYGCESGSDNTLNSMGKKADVRKNLSALKKTKEIGVSSEANIIIGLPGEKRQDIIDTINFLKLAKPDMINRAKLYPIPATKYYNQLLQEGILERPRNWNELMEKYVSNEDFTFANMDPMKFNLLKNKMDREVILPTNYMFRIKTNWEKKSIYAFQQFVLMLLHCGVLYLPSPFRMLAKRLAAIFQIKSRYVFK